MENKVRIVPMNGDHLDQVAELDDKDFVLRDGSRVPISRSERHEIHQRYQDYSFAKGNFR